MTKMFTVKWGLVLLVPPLPLSPDTEVQKVWSQLLQESCRKYTFKLLKKTNCKNRKYWNTGRIKERSKRKRDWEKVSYAKGSRLESEWTKRCFYETVLQSNIQPGMLTQCTFVKEMLDFITQEKSLTCHLCTVFSPLHCIYFCVCMWAVTVYMCPW